MNFPKKNIPASFSSRLLKVDKALFIIYNLIKIKLRSLTLKPRRETMKRMKRSALLVFIGAILYLNIGYLMAYSLDSSAKPTVASNIVYHVTDFAGFMGKAKLNNMAGQFYLMEKLNSLSKT